MFRKAYSLFTTILLFVFVLSCSVQGAQPQLVSWYETGNGLGIGGTTLRQRVYRCYGIWRLKWTDSNK